MSLVYPKDCMAHHLARPVFRQVSVAAVPCSVYAEGMQVFETDDRPTPEGEALDFYLAAHAFAEVQQRVHPLEPLSAEYAVIVDDFFRIVNKLSRRALYYLLIICTRETRHLHSKSEWADKLVTTQGPAVAAYVSSLPDTPQKAMQIFKTNPPDAPIGAYVEALYTVFAKGSWSKGYGGKAWANVTDCLRSFINGKFSLLMMLDTVWTLAHNNGPIFNKGDLFSNYHSGYSLTQILDVQRAGMIPNLLLSGGAGSEYARKETKTRAQELQKVLGFSDVMDWQKVNDLGSVLDYDSTGNILGTTKHKQATAKNTQSLFTVYPGFYLPKLKRAA